MNLQEIRDLFLKSTGRTDLGTIGSTDNGANRLITEGQRELDKMVEHPKTKLTVRKALTSGDNIVELQNLRYVQHVWTNDADDRNEVAKETWKCLREYYEDSVADIEVGEPLFWAELPYGLAPQQGDLTAVTYTTEFTLDSEEVKFGNHWPVRAIQVFPPADGTYELVIQAAFYSPELSEDTDRSYWTEVQPFTLVLAAQYVLEIMVHNNAERAAKYMAAMRAALHGIDADEVDADLPGILQMNG